MIFLCKLRLHFNHILKFQFFYFHFSFLFTHSLLVGLSELLDAFLVNFLVREQSGILHLGEKLLTGELIQVDAVQDHLLFFRLAIFVSGIPQLEKAESVLG